MDATNIIGGLHRMPYGVTPCATAFLGLRWPGDEDAHGCEARYS